MNIWAFDFVAIVLDSHSVCACMSAYRHGLIVLTEQHSIFTSSVPNPVFHKPGGISSKQLALKKMP